MHGPTGHFTQEDPIGLAGGMNLYGFAGGDPVNFSDPFGLCPPQDRDIASCDLIQKAANWAARNGHTGTLNTIAGVDAVATALTRTTSLEDGGVGGPVSAGIGVTGKGLRHVINRHTIGGVESAGKSLFAAGEDILALVRESEGVAAVKQGFGRNFERIVNAGREIGVDRATGKPASIYTVITNIKDELITMFPGRP